MSESAWENIQLSYQSTTNFPKYLWYVFIIYDKLDAPKNPQ